jgi:hypothetical protein
MPGITPSPRACALTRLIVPSSVERPFDVSADMVTMAATGTPIVSPYLSPLMPASSLPMPASVAITALTPRLNIGARTRVPQ